MSDNNTGSGVLSIGLLVLLIIFFPIGIIVLIIRTISKTRIDHIEGNYTKAATESVKTENSILQSDELDRYNELYKKGILTRAEFEAKKNSILYKSKYNKKAVREEQKRIISNNDKLLHK